MHIRVMSRSGKPCLFLQQSRSRELQHLPLETPQTVQPAHPQSQELAEAGDPAGQHCLCAAALSGLQLQPAHLQFLQLAEAGWQGSQAVVGHRQALQPRKLPNASRQLRQQIAVKQQHLQDGAICTVNNVQLYRARHRSGHGLSAMRTRLRTRPGTSQGTSWTQVCGTSGNCFDTVW